MYKGTIEVVLQITTDDIAGVDHEDAEAILHEFAEGLTEVEGVEILDAEVIELNKQHPYAAWVG